MVVALTEIDVCKLALSRLRVEVSLPAVSVVTGLDPTASKAEKELQTWYALTVQEMHEKIAWRPATTFAALTLVSTDDGLQTWSGTFLYRYRYPTDCADLRAIRVPGDGRKLLRQREWDITFDGTGRLIAANFNPLHAEYIAIPTAVTVYGAQALVSKAISLRLALNIGPGLGISDATMVAVGRDYAIALAEASSKDANEAEEGDEPDSDFASARWGG